jgi:hypothetical protein
MSNYNCIDEMIYYATLIRDYDRVLAHYLNEKQWTHALDVLTKQVLPY